jgi:putative lipase involved disintegration of autophagic bodies
MATLLELARMSDAVYTQQPQLAGWVRTGFQASSGALDGFQAAIFTRGGEVVVVFRGTAQAMDGIADLKLGTGMNSTYFDAGDQIAAAYQGQANVTVTGHSLGGAIAQVVANRGGFVMATFNAPGVGVIASRNIGQSNPAMNVVRTAGMLASSVRHPVQAMRDVTNAFRQVRGVNLCLEGDAVSRIGNHYGRVLRIHGTSTNPLTEHRITTLISVLERPENAALANRTPMSF